MKIRPMSSPDWPAVRTIYQEGIQTGHATFETEAPSWEEWNRSHLACCRLVAEEDGRVVKSPGPTTLRRGLLTNIRRAVPSHHGVAR